MKRILFFLSLVLVTGCSQEDPNKVRERQIHSIDVKIEDLRQRIKTAELKAMEAEVEGQAPMIDNYGKFAKKMEKIQKNESKSRGFEREIELLEEEKALLIRSK